MLREDPGLDVGILCLSFDPISEPTRDRRVVFRGPPEGSERQPPAHLLWNLSLALEGGKHLIVVLRRGDDRNGPEVLRRRPQHRWPSDVDLLDGLLLRDVASDGLLERIEVDADKVYRADVLIHELSHVVGVFEVGEDAAVDFRVQRLDPPAEYLRRPRHLRDRDDSQSGLRESLRRAAGRDDLKP